MKRRSLFREVQAKNIAKKWLLWLVLGLVLAAALVTLAAPAPVYAGGRAAAIAPGLTPTPLEAAKVGSNAHLAIGALVLVVIILIGVGLNFRRKK